MPDSIEWATAKGVARVTAVIIIVKLIQVADSLSLPR